VRWCLSCVELVHAAHSERERTNGPVCLFRWTDACNVDCVRERVKQKLQSAMRMLRKSINKQQFYIQFSGTEYEVAQKPSQVPEGAKACSTGQDLRDGKCGESRASALAMKKITHSKK